MSKIDITPVIQAHFKTLRDHRFGNAVSKPDIALFFVMPLVLALIPIVLGFGFRIDAVNGFLNVFAVLTGLLLNLLVLVFTLASVSNPTAIDQHRRKALLLEVFANVCFSVLVAIAVVCTAIVALSYMRSVQYARTGIVATFLLSSLTINFVLTLLMVIKRMYVLLTKEIDRGITKRAA